MFLCYLSSSGTFDDFVSKAADHKEDNLNRCRRGQLKRLKKTKKDDEDGEKSTK